MVYLTPLTLSQPKVIQAPSAEFHYALITASAAMVGAVSVVTVIPDDFADSPTMLIALIEI